MSAHFNKFWIPPPLCQLTDTSTPLICWRNTWIEDELLDDLYDAFQIIQICFSIIIRNRFLGVGAVFKDIRAWLWEFFRAHFKKTERKKFQGKWILWKTSAGVQNCPNPMKSVKIKHNPKIASWAKIYKNANFKGSLSTLSFRPFFGQIESSWENCWKLETQWKGGYPWLS